MFVINLAENVHYLAIYILKGPTEFDGFLGQAWSILVEACRESVLRARRLRGQPSMRSAQLLLLSPVFGSGGGYRRMEGKPWLGILPVR